VHVPPLPNVPVDYRAALEVTTTQYNHSTWVHEVWDSTKKRTREDRYFDGGGWATNLIEYDNHFRYSIINGSQCTRHPLSPTYHMPPSIFDLFRMHGPNLIYQGKDYERGIHCHIWGGNWDWYSEEDQKWYHEDAVWYFAVGNMVLIENPTMVHRPVFAGLQSNRSHPLFTGPDLHWFTFMDYQDNVAGAAERQIELSPWWNCPGGPPMPSGPDQGKDGMSPGGVAGMSIFMLMLGGALGFGSFWYYQQRKTQAGAGAVATSSYSADVDNN